MKIEAGKYYKTREGRKALIAGININSHPSAQVVGWIGSDYCNWYLDGKYTGVCSSPEDLISEWREPIKLEIPKLKYPWVAINRNGSWLAYSGERPHKDGNFWTAYQNCDHIGRLFDFPTIDEKEWDKHLWNYQEGKGWVDVMGEQV